MRIHVPLEQFLGHNRGRVFLCWPWSNSFSLFGFSTSVPFSWKLIKKWNSKVCTADGQTAETAENGKLRLCNEHDVRLSVCNVGELWSHTTRHCRIFDTTRMGNHSSFVTPNSGWWRTPHSGWNSRSRHFSLTYVYVRHMRYLVKRVVLFIVRDAFLGLF